MVAASPTSGSQALLTASRASLRLAAANTVTLSSARAVGTLTINSAVRPPTATAFSPNPLPVMKPLPVLKSVLPNASDRYIRLNITREGFLPPARLYGELFPAYDGARSIQRRSVRGR